MSCVSVLEAFHVNTASTASGSGLKPCLSIILPRYLIESLRVSHFDGLHFKPAPFMHPKSSSSQSMWSSRVGVACCYDHVIHVTHHEIPVLLRHSGQSLSHQSLKRGLCVAQFEGHPLPHVQPQFTCESCLLSVLHPQRDLPEGRTQVQCGEDFGITKFRETLVYLRYRVRIFYCQRVQIAKVATKPKLSPFLFRHYHPTSPWRLREFYHVVLEQHFYFRSARLQFSWLHSSCAFVVGNGAFLKFDFVFDGVIATNIRLMF